MRQRIRTVKPEFFLHSELFTAENQTGLPLRLAFVGLFTCCDREGRFKWRPMELKVMIMPYDEIDFSRVLDALATRGFVVKYTSEGKEYGVIPTFRRHQVINNRESASELPDHNDCDKLPTRDPRDDHATGTPLLPAQGEGKGREGKGREPYKGRVEHAPTDELSQDDFDTAYKSYPKRSGNMNKKRGMDSARRKVKTVSKMIDFDTAIKNYKTFCTRKRITGTEMVKQFSTFVGEWEDWLDPANWDIPEESVTATARPEENKKFRKAAEGIWSAVANHSKRDGLGEIQRRTVKLMGGWSTLGQLPEKNKPFVVNQMVGIIKQEVENKERMAQ